METGEAASLASSKGKIYSKKHFPLLAGSWLLNRLKKTKITAQSFYVLRRIHLDLKDHLLQLVNFVRTTH